MIDLIPLEKVIKENPRVEELEKQGYIIKPEKMEPIITCNNPYTPLVKGIFLTTKLNPAQIVANEVLNTT